MIILKKIFLTYLIPTIRWDSNSLFGNKFSPQLIFVYNTHQTKFSLMAGTSWRTPTFLDLYWPNQGWAKGNPTLKPEESYSADFAVEKKIQEVLFSVNLFYRYIKDQIRWYPEDPQDPLSAWTPSNVDETFVQGGEIKSCFTIAKIFKNQLSILISANRIKKKGEEERGWQKQAYSPLLTGIYSFDLNLPYEFKLINGLKYVNEQYLSDGESSVKLDSYVLWNVKISKNILNFVDVYIQINDLFDQKGVNRVGYPQYGRSYELGVNLRISF
ncbi:MAG: TonB-dependent receptor [candidate division WOR-3 bacterium]